jgi:hypothetical protein
MALTSFSTTGPGSAAAVPVRVRKLATSTSRILRSMGKHLSGQG